MSSNRKRCSRSWGYFCCFLLLCKQGSLCRQVGRRCSCAAQVARCFGPERRKGENGGQLEKKGYSMWLCFLLSARLTFTARQEDQGSEGTPSFYEVPYVLMACSDVQQAAAEVSAQLGVNRCPCCFPEAVCCQRRWGCSGETVTVMNT